MSYTIARLFAVSAVCLFSSACSDSSPATSSPEVSKDGVGGAAPTEVQMPGDSELTKDGVGGAAAGGSSAPSPDSTKDGAGGAGLGGTQSPSPDPSKKGLGGTTGTDTQPPLDASSPWTSGSQHLEVFCGSFFGGSMQYRADRADLTQPQLDLLSQLKLTRGGTLCATDSMGCHISITDAAGAVASYNAVEYDGHCNNKDTSPLVVFESLRPLLKALDCKYAKLLSDAIRPNPQCLNGLFTPYSGTTIRQNLTVPDANAAHTVTLLHCDEATRIQNISMNLFVEGQTTPVATGTPVTEAGPDHACLQIKWPNVAAAELVIVTTSDFLPAGDFYLKFE